MDVLTWIMSASFVSSDRLNWSKHVHLVYRKRFIVKVHWYFVFHVDCWLLDSYSNQRFKRINHESTVNVRVLSLASVKWESQYTFHCWTNFSPRCHNIRVKKKEDFENGKKKQRKIRKLSVPFNHFQKICFLSLSQMCCSKWKRTRSESNCNSHFNCLCLYTMAENNKKEWKSIEIIKRFVC